MLHYCYRSAFRFKLHLGIEFGPELASQFLSFSRLNWPFLTLADCFSFRSYFLPLTFSLVLCSLSIPSCHSNVNKRKTGCGFKLKSKRNKNIFRSHIFSLFTYPTFPRRVLKIKDRRKKTRPGCVYNFWTLCPLSSQKREIFPRQLIKILKCWIQVNFPYIKKGKKKCEKGGKKRIVCVGNWHRFT